MASTDEPDILRHIDRLVDGELSRGDESRLLSRLDSTPDGWRQLALAFVEARRWRTAMIERTTESANSGAGSVPAAEASHSIPTTSVPATAAPTGGSRRLFAAALAASLVAGALGGLGIARWRADGRATASLPGTSSNSLHPGETLVEPVKNRGPSSLDRPHDTPNDAALAGSDRPLDPSPSSERALTMFVGGGTSDGAKPIDIPVIPVAQADPTWLDAEKASVPETFREAMEKQGRVVNVRRQFYPVLLNDGRRVIVPIDDVEVR